MTLVAPSAPRTTANLGERAMRGIVTLAAREGAMKLLAFGGDIALYRLLTPADFGVIVPVAFLAGLVKQFADLGLQPSVVQRPSEPRERELRAVFTAQLGLVVCAATIVFFAGPFMVDGLLGREADHWLIRVFALSILFSAFRIVPAALLERHLQFGRLALADISSTVSYYALGIAFAIGAAGAWSLAVAHVGASLVSTLALIALKPWRPVPTRNVARMRAFAAFGSKFQGSRLALMLKDSLIPLFAPRAYGVTATGWLSWADKISAQPLTLTQLVARVSLPAFSRIQAEPERVRAGAEFTLKWNAICTLPLFAAVLAFGPEIARYIYGEDWIPAVPALYVMSLNAALVPLNGLITPVLNALGKTRLVLAVAVCWAAAAWVTAVSLSATGMGFIAIPVALAGTQVAAALVLVPLARREFGLRLLHHLPKPLLAATLAGLVGRFVLLPMLTDGILLVQGAILVIVLYGGLVYALDRRAIRDEIATIIQRRLATRP